MAEETEKY